MSVWDAYFERGIDRARAVVLLRFVPALLAVDVCATMLQSGGRYGVGGVQVAHFAWLDAIQPVPTSALYVGTMALGALAAMVSALTTPRRWVLGVATAAFTWGWAMSQLDSYQHHYLLSWVLLALTGLAPQGQPVAQVAQDEGDEREPEAKPERAADDGLWAGPLLCVTVAIVYSFTAISKMESGWRDGKVLQRLSQGRLTELAAWWVEQGWQAESLWAGLAHATIGLQWVIALAYLILPLRARLGIVGHVISWVGFLGALSFHIGTEWIKLEIGWFSYYMLGLTVVMLGPLRGVALMARGVEWACGLCGRAVAWLAQSVLRVVVIVMGSVGVALVCASLADLPGYDRAMWQACVALLFGLAVWRARPGRWPLLVSYALAVSVAASMMLGVLVKRDIRFDFYRYIGGDSYRRAMAQTQPDAKRELLRESVQAYERAERYSTAERSRAQQLERSRQELKRMGE